MKKIFEEKISAFEKLLSNAGFSVNCQYEFKSENDAVCEEDSAKYYTVHINILDEDAKIFEKEYYLDIFSDEHADLEFSELELLAVLASTEGKDAVISHLKSEAEKAEREVSELEEKVQKSTKKAMLICGIVLGLTILAAIILPFAL